MSAEVPRPVSLATILDAITAASAEIANPLPRFVPPVRQFINERLSRTMPGAAPERTQRGQSA